MQYPFRVETLQFKEEGHRLKTDGAGGASRTLRATTDHLGRETIIEMDEVCTHIFREKMHPDTHKVYKGQFEHLHTIPNSQVKQADPAPSNEQPSTHKPPEAPAETTKERK